ncbi:MAG: hypothetical protein M5U28_52595 [Sandaracinaceae bacterium]|nr:hypothetical protein [Sandaracinaceae bacterium]
MGEPQIAVSCSMIAPGCAGVLFTRNPVDGSEQACPGAPWGLNESQ